MTVFKCKMCGSPLEVPEGAAVVTCDYCRTQQTLPRLDDERRANLYDRGNHFRRASDYDKAMRIFEQILSEDPGDAEAYWSIVLCRYGVEYVEDPASGRRVPTVNRMQESSILTDDDYKQALAHADLVQRGVYEQQAREISAIQRGIAEVAAKEEPFDVFICYKETDAQGQRTRDSVKAGELYNELVREGFRVFFARVTLEDKLGQAYEPYIYSALQSAKAMVVVATRPEYVNAPWVKNEWSRYLALIKAGERKTLIPAYLDMDPYDLPDEFSHLQAQDMSKIGFLQDLVHGLKKICGKGERVVAGTGAAGAVGATQSAVASAPSGSVAPLLKRASIFLADGEWDRADEYAERVLDLDPTCAEAYLVKVMAELKESDRDSLGKYGLSLLDMENFKKAVRFAEGNLVATIAEIRKNALGEQFQRACRSADEAQTKDPLSAQKAWQAAAREFDLAQEYPKAQECAEECRRSAQEAKRLVEEQDERVQQARNAVNIVSESRAADYVDEDGSWQDEYAEIKESLSDIVEWRGVAEVFNACDDGIKWAKQTVYNQRVNQARELLKQADARLAKEKVDKDGTIEAQYKRIKDSVLSIRRRESAALVIRDCDFGIDRARQSVVDARKRTVFRRTVSAVALLGIGVFFSVMVIRPAVIEAQAQQLEGEGDHVSAAVLYDKLGMRDKVEDNLRGTSYGSIIEAEVGDTVEFGTYEQDGSLENGQEPIEWLVLDKQDGMTLLLSKYALDSMQYKNMSVNTTWEDASIRSWLNNGFFDSAFSESDKAFVASCSVSNNGNPDYGTNGGFATTDYVYLLSINNARKYLAADADRVCLPSAYAVEQGASEAADSGGCNWWLRSPGSNAKYAAYVDSDGNIHTDGVSVNEACAVRPALWVKL